MKPATTEVPRTEQLTNVLDTDHIEEATARKGRWIHPASELLQLDTVREQSLSWAAHHSSLQSQPYELLAITALLPLFVEKADSAAMVKHVMSMIKSITQFLNPNQIDY